MDSIKTKNIILFERQKKMKEAENQKHFELLLQKTIFFSKLKKLIEFHYFIDIF